MRPPDREGPDQGSAVRHPLHQGQAGGGAHGLSPARHRTLALYGIAGSAYVLDRATKVIAEEILQRRAVELIPGVLDLRYTTNPGGAFGLFGSVPWLFASISVVVIAVVVVASFRVPSTPIVVGLGLVLAGALGNLTDRALRGPGFSGEVVDFIDLQLWPVFNVADMAIVVGAAVLFLSGLRRPTT
jgi:signal peptidase II